MDKKGQVIILFAFLLIVVLALLSLAIDGALYVAHWQGLQTDLDAACVAAGNYLETDAPGAFYASLASNSVPETATIVAGPSNTWLTTAEGPHEFYLAQFMGITSMDVAVRSRCLLAKAGTPPIIVQEIWVIDSQNNGVDFPIFGHEAEAEDGPNSSFRGAVLPQIWCQDVSGAVSDQCEVPLWFDPLEEATSSQQYKYIVEDLIKSDVGAPWVPIGTRIAHIAGVSTKPTVMAMVDAGYVRGDHIIVMVFDGSIIRPDISPIDNVAILYYIEAEITDFDQNTMWASFEGYEPLLTQAEVTFLSTSRVVPWTWGG